MAGNATFVSASTSSTELMFSASYLNGQRGSSLERSRSYRDGSESRMLGSGFAVPRGGSSSVAVSDGMRTLSQCISLEPIVIPRQIEWYDELRRGLGISATAEENSFRAAATYVKPVPPMADLKDLKRLRLNVEDLCIKARARENKIDERLRKLEKYCEHVASKKQKRNEIASIDRAGALNLKTGIYGMNQRVEDRPKNILLNKRFRTTVTESQAKDGNSPEDNIGDSDLFEKIPRLAAGGEGWDKKGKRRRSVGTVPPRAIDNGVPKKAVQNKLAAENGSQSCDPHIYRPNNRDDSLSNRKHPMPSGLSSPPMAAQWGGQRPKKMARARRPFLVSPASNQDEKHSSFESPSPPDVGARLTSTGINSSHAPKIAASSPKKFVVKFENVQSSPRLTESQQSVGGQSQFTDKEIENRDNKNKPLTNSANRRSFQSRKMGGKKNGSKPGRRLKKLSDRKGFAHPSPSQNVSSPDCTGASDDDREELLAAASHARTAAHLACSSPFWKKMEPVFAPVSSEDKLFLAHQVDSISDPLFSENGSFPMKQDADKTSKESMPLYQRVLSALIIEDDIDTPEDEDTRAMQFPDPFSVSTYDTYNANDSSYENMGLTDKLLLELESIGVCPDKLPVLEDDENETIQKAINDLNTWLHQQEVRKKARLEKVRKDVDSNSRELETLAMDRLVEVAYRKLSGSKRSSRSGIQRLPKPAALAFAKRTLVRCHKFENSGTSCFNEPAFQDILSAPVTRKNHPDEPSPTNGSLPNRGKKKEVSLDDISTTRMTPAPGKRTEAGPSKLHNTKPKQKTENRSDNKHVGTTHPTGPSWLSSSNRVNDAVDELEPLDDLVGGSDLGGAHDLTSFLNFDEQDPEVDFTAGLDIPMDDLTELF